MNLVKRNIDQQGGVDEQTQQVFHLSEAKDSIWLAKQKIDQQGGVDFLNFMDVEELVKQNIDQQGSVDEQTQQVSHFLYFHIIKLLVNGVVLTPTTRGV